MVALIGLLIAHPVGNRQSTERNGNFVSDGSNAIVKTGDEYFNIFPAWNWTRIPGTTAPQMPDVPLGKNAWELRGISQFDGGVSDSLYGATTYYYDDTYGGIHTQARKAWFFFDHEVVCLGAGITSGSPYDVMTTVNQDIDYKGSTFTYLAEGKRPGLKEGDSVSSASIKWVRHGDTGYIFPKGGRILVQRKMQQGDWHYINHAEEQYRDSNIRIKVDAPCALMVSRKADGRVWLHIADPLQKEQIINLELKVDGDMKKTKKLSCNFTHMGEEAGRTKAFLLN